MSMSMSRTRNTRSVLDFEADEEGWTELSSRLHRAVGNGRRGAGGLGCADVKQGRGCPRNKIGRGFNNQINPIRQKRPRIAKVDIVCRGTAQRYKALASERKVRR